MLQKILLGLDKKMKGRKKQHKLSDAKIDLHFRFEESKPKRDVNAMSLDDTDVKSDETSLNQQGYDMPSMLSASASTSLSCHTPYSSTYEGESTKDLEEIDFRKKRVVFTSLLNLYMSYCTYEFPEDNVWKKAICIFLCPRRWVFPANRDEVIEARKTFVYQLFLVDAFKMLILQKEQQGQVIWLDSKDPQCWEDVSKQLTDLTDPCTGSQYQPLKCDVQFWLQKYTKKQSKFGVSGPSVVNELLFPKNRFRIINEILWQSNPTLIPMSLFDEETLREERKGLKTCGYDERADADGFVYLC